VIARDAIEDIKRYAPASLKVTLQDGTEKAVAVPKAGNRWARTSQVLDSLLWVQIECLDKDGKLLGVIEDDEDILEEGDDAGGNTAMARVLMDVMRTTMKETRLMFDAQLRGQAELLSAMTEGMRHVSESYNQALKVQQAHLLAAPSAEGAAGDSAEMMRMMQMAMTMMNQQKVGP